MKFMRIKLTTDQLNYLISVGLKTCLIKYIHLVLTLGKEGSIMLQQGRKKSTSYSLIFHITENIHFQIHILLFQYM